MATEMKSDYLKAFNQLFFDFLANVIEIVENKEIEKSKFKFEMIRVANPSIIIKVWHTSIYTVYQDVIDRGDVSFFIEKDYQDDLAYLSKTTSGEILRIINSIRGPIQSLSAENKQCCMQYIQNLSQLSTLYHTTSIPTPNR